MDLIIVCAGKTAKYVSELLPNLPVDYVISGYYDFMDNDPYCFGLISKDKLLSHEGDFLIASVMVDTVEICTQQLVDLGLNYKNIKNLSDILRCQTEALDYVKIKKVAALLGNQGEFFKKIIYAKASFDFDYFANMGLGGKADSEYFDYDLFPSEGVVIDAGSFDGDTAKKMAIHMNAGATIFSFDASLKYVKIANRLPCIDFIEAALCKQDGFLSFHEYPGTEAPGSFVSEAVLGNDVQLVRCTSIDSFVEQREIKQLGFIKMDIEGSEINALIGAQKAIRNFMPPMAISIYHKLSDHWEIPLLVLDIQPGYSIFIGHYSNNFDATVMYFKPTKA